MPIYEYACEECGQVSEFLVGVGEEDQKIHCRHCSSLKVNQQLSASNFSLHGSRTGSQPGKTCCGREERCTTPPCSGGGGCRR